MLVQLARLFSLIGCALIIEECKNLHYKLVPSGWLIFGVYWALCLSVAVMTFFRTTWAFWTLKVLLVVIPLSIWLMIDILELYVPNVWALVFWLLVQNAVPLIFVVILHFSKSVRKYFNAPSCAKI